MRLNKAALNLLRSTSEFAAEFLTKAIRDRQLKSYESPEGVPWGAIKPYTEKYARWKANLSVARMKKYAGKRASRAFFSKKVQDRYSDKNKFNALTYGMDKRAKKKIAELTSMANMGSSVRKRGGSRSGSLMKRTSASAHYVNLRLSGRMAGAIGIKTKSEERTEIGITNPKSNVIAHAQHFKYGRPFFRTGRLQQNLFMIVKKKVMKDTRALWKKKFRGHSS